MQLDDQGREIPDPTPIVIRVRTGVISQFDQVRAFIRNELSRQAGAEGFETIDDANDFDVDDDLFPVSPHEYTADTEAADREALAAAEARAKAKPASGKPDAGAGGAGVADPRNPEPPELDAQ